MNRAFSKLISASEGRYLNAVEQEQALAASLGGGALKPPPLLPLSAIIDQEDELAAEIATLSAVRDYVATWHQRNP